MQNDAVCPSVYLKLRSVKPIRFYSLGNIPTGHVMVLGYFLGGWPFTSTKFLFLFVSKLQQISGWGGERCPKRLGAKPLVYLNGERVNV